MDKLLRQSLLYDFYGELLTEHQKQIYEDVVMNDLSYSEIAREAGISRQGVYDMMKRSEKILEEYEEKLQLVKKFVTAREKIEEMKEDIQTIRDKNQDKELEVLLGELAGKSSYLLEEF